MPLEQIEYELDILLKNNGFIYRDKTDIEIYNQILDNNKLSQIYKLKNLFYESIMKIKESVNREDYIEVAKKYIVSLNNDNKSDCIKQFNYINEFYQYYFKETFNLETYSFDYSDLIYYSNKYIRDKRFLNDMRYDYIIIDEYQDISDGEYLLARNTSNKNDSTVFAVGDDWQSIYSFRGSNINYITKFNNYFDRPTILSINNTYRNSQELVNITGKFIKENKDQIDKSLVSLKHLEHPVHFVIYDDRIDEEMGNSILDETVEYDVLKKLIMKEKIWKDK
jgi:DNA helicase-4